LPAAQACLGAFFLQLFQDVLHGRPLVNRVAL
jgi:hypothetical protein